MNISKVKNVIDSVATIKQKVELMKHFICDNNFVNPKYCVKLRYKKRRNNGRRKVNSLKKQLHQN